MVLKVNLFPTPVATKVTCNGSRLLFSHMKNEEKVICDFHTSNECHEDLMSYSVISSLENSFRINIFLEDSIGKSTFG